MSNEINGCHKGLVMGCHGRSSLVDGVKKDGEHVSKGRERAGVSLSNCSKLDVQDQVVFDINLVDSARHGGLANLSDGKLANGAVGRANGIEGKHGDVLHGGLHVEEDANLVLGENCVKVGCLPTISGLDKKKGVVDIDEKGEDLLNEVFHRDNNGQNFQMVVGDMCNGQIIQRMDDSHGRIFQHKDANVDINGQNCQRKVVVDDLPPLNKSIQQGMGVIESKCGALGSISGIGNVGHEIGANGADSTKLDGSRINVIESPSNYGGVGLARDDNRKEKLGNLHFGSDVGVIGPKSSALGSISGLGSFGQGGADLGPFSTTSSMHDQGLKPSYAKAVQNSSPIACEVRSSITQIRKQM
ncbi:hypothetical protein ACOSQ4_002815 [Xanthoceras sorbifolium]